MNLENVTVEDLINAELDENERLIIDNDNQFIYSKNPDGSMTKIFERNMPPKHLLAEFLDYHDIPWDWP